MALEKASTTQKQINDLNAKLDNLIKLTGKF